MEQMVVTPFYLDWTFWAVVIAAIAVILSQLPPLYNLIKRAKLDLELFSRFHITHKVGNPNVQLHMILTNLGGRSVRIKGVSLTIKRDGEDLAVLPAQTYYQNQGDTGTVLFTSFELKSKEEWAHTVTFLNYFDRPDEKRYRNSESLIKKNIAEKRQLLKNKDRIIKADSKYVKEFIKMFDDKFIWYPGEYELHISVTTSENKTNISKVRRFTLFESDSNVLSNYKNDYKTGDGIFWESGKLSGIILPIVEA